MPLGRVDQALVQRLEHIDFDVAQPKARGLAGDPQHQVAAVRHLDDPVEKVAFDRALNADFVECSTGKDRRRVIGRQVEHPGRDRLRDNRQIGVLQKQRVVADRRAVGLAQ